MKSVIKTSAIKKNHMLESAENILAYKISLSQDYNTACQLIYQFTTNCRKKNYNLLEINDASFFLCTLLDEENKDNWPQSLLNTFHPTKLKDSQALQQHLQKYQENPQSHTDLLELIYFCLKLRSRIDNKITSLVDDIYANIQPIDKEKLSSLTNTDYQSKTYNWHFPSIWITVAVTIVILGSVFLPYQKKLQQYTKPILNKLQAINLAGKLQ